MMVYFDTNVLIYAFCKNADDISQQDISVALFDKGIREHNIILSEVVLCEFAFISHRLKEKPQDIEDNLQFLSHFVKGVDMKVSYRMIEVLSQKGLYYALKLMSYFESRKFYEILYRLMGGASEDIVLEVLLRLEILRDIDSSLYETFLRLVFVHYSSEQTASSGIQIDHQAIATHLAKQLHIEFKESFGTDRNGAFLGYITKKSY